MKNCLSSFIFTLLLLSLTERSYPQSSQTTPFDSGNWTISGAEHRIEDYLGRKSLYLKGGIAIINNSNFLNGIIEFDIAFSDERGFTGVIWRMQDDHNYEEFYFRPHNSGKPDANQYQPVYNGVAAWQLYYGEKYSAPTVYEFNKWMQVKIIVSGKQADIYIGDMKKPALLVNDLKRNPEAGKVGITVSDFAPAYYSNFRYTVTDNPGLIVRKILPEITPPGSIMSWSVSNAFDETSFLNKTELDASELSKFEWKILKCENTGLANLALIQEVEEKKNTVFARININSEKDQVKKLEFGFSDRVKIFFNNKLLFGGNNNYLSRDYRFLGTIGYFDELYLPLKKGENELIMAVSEDFGGWGILAKIEDSGTLSFK